MKSILVIDTPKDCLACPCIKLFADAEYCSVNMKPLGVHIPKWCPLRPLPQEKELGDFEEITWDDDIYALGFNRCLHEITGETE